MTKAKNPKSFGSKSRTATSTSQPHGKKVPTHERATSDAFNQLWSFEKCDRNGKFYIDANRGDFDCKLVLTKMMEYNRRTWADIMKETHDRGKSKHHFLSVGALSSEAKARVRALQREEDTDRLFSLRLDNKTRLIGYREEHVFFVIAI